MKKLGKPTKEKQVYDWDNNLKTITSQEVLQVTKKEAFKEDVLKPFVLSIIAFVVMFFLMLGIILCM